MAIKIDANGIFIIKTPKNLIFQVFRITSINIGFMINIDNVINIGEKFPR